MCTHAPTCFGLQGNHHQEASQRLAKITHLVHADTQMAVQASSVLWLHNMTCEACVCTHAPTCFGLQGNHHQGASQRLAKITLLVHADTQMAVQASSSMYLHEPSV